MNQKPINQHKRYAMGDSPKGYKDGGRVGMPSPPASKGRPMPSKGVPCSGMKGRKG